MWFFRVKRRLMPSAAFARCPRPRLRAVDSVAILVKPRAQRAQTFHLYRWYGSVRLRTDIQKQIAVLADNIRQQID